MSQFIGGTGDFKYSVNGKEITIPSLASLSSSTRIKIGLTSNESPSIDTAKSTSLSEQSDDLFLFVNTVDDPGIAAIDFNDNLMSFREAIHLSQHPDISTDTGIRDNVYIVFEENVQGKLNNENMPDHMFYIDSPLPVIHKGDVKINTIKPQSVIISPAFDGGGIIKNLGGPIISIGGHSTPSEGDRPIVELNRLNFIRNTTDPYNQFYKYSPSEKDNRKKEIITHYGSSSNWRGHNNAGITLYSGDLKVTNSIFQNLKSYRSGYGVAIANMAPSPEDRKKAVDGWRFAKGNWTDYDTASLILSNVRFQGNQGMMWNPNYVGPPKKVSNIFVNDIDNSPVQIHNVEVEGSLIKPARIAEGNSIYASLKKYEPTSPQVESGEFIYESKSYLYQKGIANIMGNNPIQLSPDKDEFVMLSYDRPTAGDVGIFTDFSKLLNEVKSLNTGLFDVTKEVIEGRKEGIDPDIYDKKLKDLEIERQKSWATFGISLATSLIGLDISGVTQEVGDNGKTKYTKKTYFNSRNSIYKNSSKKFGSSFATGLTAALPVAGLIAGTTMKVIGFAKKQEQFNTQKEELNEFRQEAKKNLSELNNKTQQYDEKMNQFANNAFDPGIGLSFKSLKQQRKPIIVNNFEFGQDMLIIPSFGEDMSLRFNHLSDSINIDGSVKTRKGFDIQVSDPDRDENPFVIAKVFVNTTNHHDTLDYGKVAESVLLRKSNQPKAPSILFQGRSSEIKQIRQEQVFDYPVHSTIRIKRNNNFNLSDVITTSTGIGHDNIYGTNGPERIKTYDGDDIVRPGLGTDIINGMSGNDAVLYGDLDVPLKVLGESNQGQSKYTVNTLDSNGNDDVILSTLRNIEIIEIPDNSIVDLSNLPQPKDGAEYKQIIAEGVNLTSSSFDDIIQYNFSSSNAGFSNDDQNLIAIVSGGSGNDTLLIERELLPKGSNLSLSKGSTPGSGTIKFIPANSNLQSYDLLKFTSIENIDSNVSVSVDDNSDPGLSTLNVSSSLANSDNNNNLLGGATRFKNAYQAIKTRGSKFSDHVNGGYKADLLIGRDGDDHLNGYSGTDELRGGDGSDTLFGGKDADILAGGPNADTLFGGSGNDLLKGGKGRDKFYFSKSSGVDSIVDFRASEKIVIMTDSPKRFSRGLKVFIENGSTTLDFPKNIGIQLTGFDLSRGGLDDNLAKIIDYVPVDDVPF